MTFLVNVTMMNAASANVAMLNATVLRQLS